MKIVIVGAGRVGIQLAKQLIEENHNVVLIDKNPEKTRTVSNQLDCMILNKEGNNFDVLKQAGINKADFFISVTDSDEVNMVLCGLVTSEFTVPNKIARVRNMDYSSSRFIEEASLGIDFIVNPEIEAGNQVIRSIEHGAVGDIIFFENTNVQMRNMNVNDKSILKGRTLKDIRSSININFIISVIMRENQYIIPKGDTIIQENDNIYIVATEESQIKLFDILGKSNKKLKKIVIIGGGKIGSHIASNLIQKQKTSYKFINLLSKSLVQRNKRNINIIDKNYETCKQLSDSFPEALVINADISDEGILEDEQFTDYDLIVTTTDNQELNIVTSIYAKTLGIKRSIALVNKYNYFNIAYNLGIDVAVSPNNSMINTIMKYIRKGNIKGVHSISDGKVEVIELTIEEFSKAIGKTIKETRLPAHSLVIAVVRGDKNIIPDGKYIIQADDHLILMAKKENIPKLVEVFMSQ